MKRGLILMGAVCLLGVFPLCAQEDDGKLVINFGGGLNVPLNPTANFAGVGGSFLAGGGYNLNRHSAVLGQFQWAGLPPSISAKAQLLGGSASVNLYSLTANYQFRGNFGSTFGYYLFAGGGWFYRHSSLSHTSQFVTPVVCEPVWDWYGTTCTDGVTDVTRTAGSGTSSAGANGGAGLTLRVSDTRWKFFVESRYIYANSRAIATTTIPVAFGIMFQ
jgi:hypothetical protein